MSPHDRVSQSPVGIHSATRTGTRSRAKYNAMLLRRRRPERHGDLRTGPRVGHAKEERSFFSQPPQVGGLAPCLQAGLGDEEHPALALRLQSPLEATIVLDDDVPFVVRAIIAFGPRIRTWRRQQAHAWRALCKALSVLNVALRALHPVTFKAVAGQKSPAAMAAATILLRWPDWTQPSIFVTGFWILDAPETTTFSGTYPRRRK